MDTNFIHNDINNVLNDMSGNGQIGSVSQYSNNVGVMPDQTHQNPLQSSYNNVLNNIGMFHINIFVL